ncbi:hypothetical protein FUAX_51380 (plasmid) [Fulvitalea axinellae]|uniref:Uncharacterized protein n=1 Tax=Fulvitalea axinellae TaxID=1182444 RepID=A0AAU9CUI4_9BACT|nr:hypothetical protein FUAX_51380 [Fulvitalea axinellae]
MKNKVIMDDGRGRDSYADNVHKGFWPCPDTNARTEGIKSNDQTDSVSQVSASD